MGGKADAAANEPHWIGFDLGGTKMLSVVYDTDYQPLGRKRKRTRGREGMRAGLQRIAECIRKSLERAEVEPAQLAGIGVGAPGAIDLAAGVIRDAPNLGWQDVPIAEFLREEFGCPTVLCNDVDAGVYGEYRFGAAVGARCVVGIFPGTGIGGGCIYEGKIIHGMKSSAMEIGHLPLAGHDRPCGCGRTGCLETEASRLAISAEATKAVYRGEAPHLAEIAGTELQEVRSGALAESVARGDKAVERIVIRAARYVGLAAAVTVNLLAPEKIVLGGGLVEAMPDLWREEVGRAARERAMPALADSFEVVAAELGDDATALGAAAWVRQTLNTTAGVTP